MRASVALISARGPSCVRNGGLPVRSGGLPLTGSATAGGVGGLRGRVGPERGGPEAGYLVPLTWRSHVERSTSNELIPRELLGRTAKSRTLVCLGVLR
jgi:hypothetical protein